MLFERIRNEDFEQIVFCHDRSVGLKAIIAVHSTALGPATGGCRMWNYSHESEALEDVLRLSKGMTYKASLAGLNWGGGKAVIIGDPHQDKSPELLKRFGQYVHRLSGSYVSAKDVGIGASDLRTMKTQTPFVLGIEGDTGSSGDPSPATGYGVYQGLLAAVEFAQKGRKEIRGLRVAVQGLGSVARYLISYLVKAGAEVIACDVDSQAVDRAVKEFGIEIVRPEAIFDVPCDVFAPCALGAILNESTIPRLKTQIIAGGSNNQLATPQDGVELKKRGILYAPDYAINAGGLINIYHEGSAFPSGYDRDRAYAHVSKIHGTLTRIFERAETQNLPTEIVADRMAEERVNAARAPR